MLSPSSSPSLSPSLQIIMMMMMLMIMRVALRRRQLRLCLCLAWPSRLASVGLGLRAVGGCTTMPNSLIDRIGRQAGEGGGEMGGGVGYELCHSLNVAHM